VDQIAVRSEALAAAGQWEDVYQLLVAADRASLLRNESLAYRFAETLYYTARFAELGQYAAQYEASARKSADMRGVMRAINFGGIALFELGRTAEAQERFEALMELAVAENSAEMQAHTANNLGALAALHGDHEMALSHYRRCVQLYESVGHVRGVAQTIYNKGLSYSDLGRFPDAVAQFDQAIALSEGIDYEPVVAMARTARAELEVRRGDSRLGLAVADRAIELARRLRDAVTEAEALRVRALTRTDTPESALSDLTIAEELATDAGHALLKAKIERDRGRVCLRSDDGREGKRLLEQAAEHFSLLGAQAEAQNLRDELGALGVDAPQ
jgi:tetratricopeptide (TPR) repeat protein